MILVRQCPRLAMRNVHLKLPNQSRKPIKKSLQQATLLQTLRNVRNFRVEMKSLVIPGASM
ncbi:hypothetical protein F442_17585 [Phytophthora nicotianae P10297]|uniref:Uncharacterized protein n=1 Tax=Phytophthora nicotianae P10297 TaxID=1317064 RepID=W2YH87_PHYNI|nr:hypothetical protein F442_17585 [Phytophthora nicotianae P10297]